MYNPLAQNDDESQVERDSNGLLQRLINLRSKTAFSIKRKSTLSRLQAKYFPYEILFTMRTRSAVESVYLKIASSGDRLLNRSRSIGAIPRRTKLSLVDIGCRWIDFCCEEKKKRKRSEHSKRILTESIRRSPVSLVLLASSFPSSPWLCYSLYPQRRASSSFQPPLWERTK